MMVNIVLAIEVLKVVTIRHFTALMLLAFGAIPSLHASDADISWGVNNAPPFHIPEGYFANQGVCDVMIEAFKRALPDTKQTISHYPHGRIAALIRQGQDICYPCVIRRDHDTDVAHYSDTIMQYPPHGIITRVELAKTFTEKFGNPVDFVELLKTGDYRFGQPMGRRYGTLQPYIERFLHNTSRFSEISGADANANVLAMVNAERLDFVIDYPMLLNYHNEILPINLVFLPVKQNHEETVEGAVGCPATPWGKRAIDLINSAIPAILDDVEFRQAKDRWLLLQNP